MNGSYAGGKGARMKGDFTLTKGTVLKILVGQQGVAGQGGSGGGGTFITKSDNTALIVAGGGGGAHNNAGGNGITTNSGTSGGIGTSYGGGGGGFSGSGTYATSDSNIKGGSAFTSGGQGGLDSRAASMHGGFGGGGGGMNSCSGGCAGGGGGGYNGGTPDGNAGAGGGSYNAGTNQSNTAGVKTGQGQAVITFVSPSVKSMSPASATKIQTNYVDVSWLGAVSSDATVTKYEIRAGTTSSGTNILALTNKGTTATQRLTVPTGMLGNTTIYWQVRVTDSKGRVGPWKESTVIVTIICLMAVQV